MGEHGIFVEEDAKLIVDGATLTVGPNNNYWNGITLYGDLGETQPSDITENGNYPHQGVLIMTTGTLEHAKRGVSAEPLGGIFSVSGTSIFNNNIISVFLGFDEFFVNDDLTGITKSKLKNSYFHINNNFHDLYDDGTTAEPYSQIYMKRSNFFNIQDVTINFLNTLGLASGIGVLSHSSGFQFVDGKIRRFATGIDHYGSNFTDFEGYQVFINNNIFEDNIRAATFSGQEIGSLNIYGNKFNMPELDGPGVDISVMLEGCSNYKIDENIFYGGNLRPFTTCVWASNSGSDQTNYIQNNYFGKPAVFSNFDKGILATNSNPSLQILCNYFRSAAMETGIELYDNYGNDAIAPVQGNCLNAGNTIYPEDFPTGNRLANSSDVLPGSNAHRHFKSSSSTAPVIYNHFPGEAPEFLPGNVTANECIIAGIEKDCSLPYVGPPTSSTCNANDLGLRVLELEDIIVQQSTLLAGYGRKDESEAIRLTVNIDQLKDQIFGFELYLSNEELIAVAEKIGQFDEFEAVLNLLVENAPLQSPVIEFLTAHINSLPIQVRSLLKKYAQLINQLITPQAGLSLAQEVEAELFYYAEAQKKAVILFLPACLALRVQKQVISTLENLGEKTSLNSNYFKRKLVEYQTSAGLYEAARLSLKAIDEGEDEELKAYKQLKQIELNVKEQEKGIAGLNNRERDALENIAMSNTRSGIQARNVLLHYHDSTVVVMPPLMPEDKQIKKPVDTALLSNGASNVIHPNPATGYFKLNLPQGFNGLATINLNIYNSNGQLLKQIEDFSNGAASYSISDLQEGVYVVEISSREQNLQLKNKLIIIR